MKIINSTTHKDGNKFVITPRRRFWRDKSGKFYPVEFQAMSDNRYNIVIGGDRYTYWFSPRSTNTPFLLIRDIVESGFWGLYIDGLGRTKPALIDNQHILFREIKDGVDIEFVVKNTGVEKRIIFKNRSALADFRFSIVGYPHRPAREKNCFTAGKIAFSGVSAYDSREDAIPSPVSASTVFDGRWLSFSLPEEFLDAAVFPITIDPTITIQPGADEGKDTFLIDQGDLPDRGNYWNEGICPEINSYFDARFSPPYQYRGLLQFDLSGIPAGMNILSATLYLYASYWAGTASSATFKLYRVTNEWQEGTKWGEIDEANWINRLPETAWNTPGGDYADEIATLTTTNNDDTVDITEAVQSWYNGIWQNYGMLFRITTESGYLIKRYGSSDYSDASKHPKLVIEYEEAPAIRRHFWMDEFGTLHPIGGY